MSFDEFYEQVNAEMKRQYGLDWDDACGDTEPMFRGWQEGKTAQEFVDAFGARHGLTELSEVGL